MRLLRVFRFARYRTQDIKEFLSKRLIEIHLVRETEAELNCHMCGSSMAGGHGSYKIRVQQMPIFMNHCYLVLRRHKGWCSSCKCVRSEAVEFISEESTHKSVEYSWWVGRLCEAAPVHEVANIMKESSATTWRLDYKRMKRMLGKYKIPKARRICVDEVYTRRKKKKGETRDDLFFTVICDLDTRRVIWVSYSRRKEALDEFFLIIGKQFLRLEIMKEAMQEFFHARNEDDAKTIFDNIGDLIWQAGFTPLMKWHDNLETGWKILKNYFKHRVTSAVSEGMNNVIKTLKRSAYGDRNMHYFKLKILQKCGYLNSRYMENSQIKLI